MTYQGCLTRLRQETEIDDDETAAETLRATLELLGRRISREESTKLARDLPTEMGSWLVDPETHSERSIGIHQFCERLADELDVDVDTAHHRAQASIHALEQEISPFETWALQGQLPDEYDTLF